MKTNQTLDFLSQPGPDRLRKEIQNICDSYSHPWDLLSELSQNAVDAITLHRKKFGQAKQKHSIGVTVNTIERSVEVADTGIGFNPEKFVDLLAPHGSDKTPTDPSIIGQKGVGLTYTIFISNSYYINTKSVDGSIVGKIENASTWKNNTTKALPVFVPEEKDAGKVNSADTGTVVVVKGVERLFEDTDDLFAQPVEVLRLWLQTKTAIGYLKKCFGEGSGLDIEVSLTYIAPDGGKKVEKVDPIYLLPEDIVTAGRVVDLDDFKKKAATYDDRQKASKLQGKCLKKVGAISRANRKINYYCFFAPSRNLWGDVCTKNNFVGKNSSNEVINLYEGGIYTASRGMPTSIKLEPPRTGYFGYWPNFYIILEDDSITFDLGRKSIPSRTIGLLREIAKDLFNDFTPFFSYVSSDPPVVSIAPIQQYEKMKMVEELKKLPDLKLPKVNYLKHPDSQEAAVVALFHELVGAGILEGYYTYKMGYKMTYDLWGKYEIDKSKVGEDCRKHANDKGLIDFPVVIEFKYRGEDILADFDSDRKFFTDIDMIVCWDFDETAFSRQGVAVEVLSENEKLFFGSNFKFIWPGSYNLGNASVKPVIALRRLIQDLQK